MLSEALYKAPWHDRAVSEAQHSDALASWKGGKRRIEGACSEVACGAALVLLTKRELNSLELSIW